MSTNFKQAKKGYDNDKYRGGVSYGFRYETSYYLEKLKKRRSVPFSVPLHRAQGSPRDFNVYLGQRLHDQRAV